MPLRDHFRPPLDDESSWEGFHGGWPMMIVADLVKRLPPRYVAAPRVHLGTSVEVDVATYEQDVSDAVSPRVWDVEQDDSGGLATKT